MSRKSLVLAAVVLAAAAFVGFPRGWTQEGAGSAKQPKGGDAGVGRSAQFDRWLDLLEEEVHLQAVPVKLTDALEMVLAADGGKEQIPFYIDQAAFAASDPDVAEVAAQEVTLPPHLGKVSRATLLGLLLKQLPTDNATFLVRRDGLRITTLQAASTPMLLREKVLGRYEQVPLREVLREQSERVGVSILIDPSVKEPVVAPVTVTFTNDTSLESALEAVTDMAGLEAVARNGYVYVTTPEAAQRLRKAAEERLDRQIQLQQKLGVAPDGLGGGVVPGGLGFQGGGLGFGGVPGGLGRGGGLGVVGGVPGGSDQDPYRWHPYSRQRLGGLLGGI